MKKINKKVSNILENKFISFFLIPLVLILFWFSFSLLFNKQLSFSVLEYGHSKNSFIQKPTGKLLKGEKIVGQFTAKNNYLGIIFLRFNKYVKPDYRGEDVISFKLREKGAKDIYYFNNYRSGSVENQLLFPIGFPVIADSKNKTYLFEIDSLLGNSTNALELSSSDPVLLTGYQLPKKEIFGSKLRIIKFLFEKTINSFTNIDFIFNSIIFILPLVLYILWLTLLKKSRFAVNIFSLIVILLVFIDTFLIKEVYAGILLGLIIGWIYAIKRNKLKSYFSFRLVVVLIVLWAILIYFNETIFSNKLNIWVFTFMVIGTAQMLIEEKRNK